MQTRAGSGVFSQPNTRTVQKAVVLRHSQPVIPIFVNPSWLVCSCYFAWGVRIAARQTKKFLLPFPFSSIV